MKLLALFCLGFLLAFGFPAFSGNLHPVSATIAPQLTTALNTDAPSTDANWIERGRALYGRQEYDEAIPLFEMAARESATAEKPLNQALALNYLSLAHQKLGHWQQAQAAIDASFALLEARSDCSDSACLQVLAIAHTTRGHLHFAQGEASEALESWQHAENTYIRLGESDGEVGGNGAMGSRINQAQAWELLGNYRRSCSTLLEAIGIPEKCDRLAEWNEDEFDRIFSQSPELAVTGLRSLGDTLRAIGQFDRSKQLLETALNYVREKPQTPTFSSEESQVLLSLGNTERALAKRAKNLDNSDDVEVESAIEKALEHYQQAIETSIEQRDRIKAKLNFLSLQVEFKQWLNENHQEESNFLNKFLFPDWQQIESDIEQYNDRFADPRFTIEASIDLARSLKIGSIGERNIFPEPILADRIERILITARDRAIELEDVKLESSALGMLGQLYVREEQFEKALAATERALVRSQSLLAADISYQWQSQLGQILKKQGKFDEAIQAYRSAFETIQDLRNDLIAVERDIQFDFRDDIEPMYREFASLLLPFDKPLSPANIQMVRQVIEALQINELNNFFLTGCIQTNNADLDKAIDEAQTPTAAIYTILLPDPDRLAIVLKLPGSELTVYRAEVNTKELEESVLSLTKELRLQGRPNPEFYQKSRDLFDLIIQPIEANLKTHQIKNLVFIFDDFLRGIPIAALKNSRNDKYLIEEYSVSLSLGLQFVESESVARGRNVLAAGISKENSIETGIENIARKPFPPLDHVENEVIEIQKLTSGPKELLNEKLLPKTLQQALESASISTLHIATHGNFSSNAEETYIALWQRILKVDEMARFLQVSDARSPFSSLDLLVLSACETATGDDRAALGLAGVAVKAGARGTLATLWQVNDASTATLMPRFYEKLLSQPQLTKAEALQRAQRNLLDDSRACTSNSPDCDRAWQFPHYWAPFVLVGDWR